ncbi:hypothetical protein FHR83_008514 [Actinoplanes campanulatus]|uniref:Golgi phosphoprotein 3 (GPP34) n=1 Tax=Actinoplanes campanulatus TaxID=113559 RepID=A0A7W5AQV5_9ACTN|nr:GPP34 family phosphoprotein [Actinoplanes campanulatus]MBB3100788.1 hypothetical protein [Actinoplanes campanulatus]GGN46625.1 hypothetical protein GCM10010109_81960 [Actinoplanes campanulatus]GID41301.1 hypothetical protein Aca09nite_78070 [Actinoplanes campanulatus]
MKLAPADDFYLAAHDGIGGRLLITGELLGAGLGAALLGELMFWRRLHPDGDVVHVIDPRPTGDRATLVLLERLAATPGPHALRRWIAHLATSGMAVDLVEKRLIAAGAIRWEAKRRLLGSHPPQLVFADPKSTGEPTTRIRTHLSYNETLETADLMLATLIIATGLDAYVLDTCNPRDRARLFDQFRRHLPRALGDLAGQAKGAAEDLAATRIA